MKTKDIAKQYGIDQADFEQYLKQNCKLYSFGLTGMTLNDDIEEWVQRYKYKDHIAGLDDKEEVAKRIAEAKKRQAAAEAEKRQALDNMLLTSGFSFEGYKIKKYSSIISGDGSTSIARGTADSMLSVATDVNKHLNSSLETIREKAIIALKESAFKLGCNAIIGVDFDYITLDPETANGAGGTTYLPYIFCVTANGTAVVVEKEED